MKWRVKGAPGVYTPGAFFLWALGVAYLVAAIALPSPAPRLERIPGTWHRLLRHPGNPGFVGDAYLESSMRENLTERMIAKERNGLQKHRMNDPLKKCPKCTGAMIQGFVPDFMHGGCLVGTWHEGQPRKSFWLGTHASHGDGIPIGAFRCAACGFLEFYADEEFRAQ
jgi:hypothetical protein